MPSAQFISVGFADTEIIHYSLFTIHSQGAALRPCCFHIFFSLLCFVGDGDFDVLFWFCEIFRDVVNAIPYIIFQIVLSITSDKRVTRFTQVSKFWVWKHRVVLIICILRRFIRQIFTFEMKYDIVYEN